MVNRLKTLTARIDAFHALARRAEEAERALTAEREAIIAGLVDMGIMISVARKEVAKVDIAVTWPAQAPQEEQPVTPLAEGDIFGEIGDQVRRAAGQEAA